MTERFWLRVSVDSDARILFDRRYREVQARCPECKIDFPLLVNDRPFPKTVSMYFDRGVLYLGAVCPECQEQVVLNGPIIAPNGKKHDSDELGDGVDV